VGKPESKSARPYNVMAGDFVALGAGLFSLRVLDAWASPKVLASGFIAPPRTRSATITVGIATLDNLAIGASQPASLATALSGAAGEAENVPYPDCRLGARHTYLGWSRDKRQFLGSLGPILLICIAIGYEIGASSHLLVGTLALANLSARPSAGA
jgi:hypothetical protein